MDWKVTAAIVAVFVVFMLVSRLGRASPEEAHKLVDAGALLVDVRTPEEYAAGHIEKAVNIPVSDVQKRLKEFGPKDKPIVVYCRSGARSGRAKGMLEAAGYKTVLNLGPMSAW